MRTSSHFFGSFRPSLSLIFLSLFLAVLWFAGGTSRADQLGQPIVRAASWLMLIGIALFGHLKMSSASKPVWFFLLAMILLAGLQLVPLPPDQWQALPGRQLFTQAASLTGSAQPWRPLAIVPSTAINALSSLVVPLTALVLVSGLREREQEWVPFLLLVMIISAMLVGLLQFSGTVFDNPFIDDIPGTVSGIFANRNHFALFLAFGILLAPSWALSSGKASRWRWPAAFGLILLFLLTILATGSRAGMVVGFVALVISLATLRRPIQRLVPRHSRWVFAALLATALGVTAFAVALSVSADRAVSIQRFFALNAEDDMRRQALPIIWKMIRIYFPFGSGLGDFASVFQIYEPFDFLNMTYMNRAHDDYLEIILNTGVAGLVLLIAAIGWWAMASARAWRTESSLRRQRARLGSAKLLLIFLASFVDYPARTPTIMAIVAIASIWLSAPRNETGSALPSKTQRL